MTCGFILNESGDKMSKSAGNALSPQDVIKQSGADILRLWVAVSDYTDDMMFGPQILARTSEGYRKIRNTARFLLGNLGDFDPATDAVPLGEDEVHGGVERSFERADRFRIGGGLAHVQRRRIGIGHRWDYRHQRSQPLRSRDHRHERQR